LVIELPNRGRFDRLGDRRGSKGEQDFGKFYLDQVSLNSIAI